MAKSLHNNNKGYFLIELMIAISILTVGFLGFLTLVSRSISTNRVISDYLTATYLAAEGIELIKNVIDTNYLNPPYIWNQGINADGSYEMDYNDSAPISATGNYLKYDSNNFYNYDFGNSTPFRRIIEISNVSADQIKVKSIVQWKGRGSIDMEVYVEDYFFNWRP